LDLIHKDEMHHFCFNLVDKDNRGKVTAEGFAALAAMLAEDAPHLYPAQLQRAFKKFDSSSDGKMGVADFKRMIVHFPVLF
jgi:Ca2+-binding EF-hand superfamily protein